jgi:hypothetical protein
MLVYTPFTLCFVTLRGVFMHFLELTYQRDATVLVPVFTIFVFQKSYTGNILENWTKQKPKFLFSQSVTESKGEPEWCQEAAAPPHGAGPLTAPRCGWCGPLDHFLMLPFHLYIPLDGKPERPDQFSKKPTASCRHH